MLDMELIEILVTSFTIGGYWATVLVAPILHIYEMFVDAFAPRPEDH